MFGDALTVTNTLISTCQANQKKTPTEATSFAVMQELMKESHGITAYLAIHRPQVLYMLIDCRMDTKDQPVPQPPVDFWLGILVCHLLAAYLLRSVNTRS